MNARAAGGGSTRDRLVQSARELFTEHGYQEASIKEVLDRTGVSRGALYHYFASKEQLFEAVLTEIEGEIEQALLAAGSGAASGGDALRAGCARWLDLVQDPAVRRIVLVDAPAAVGWAKWRAIDARHGLGLIRLALQAEADAGRIAHGLVEYDAHILLAALLELGLLVANATDPSGARAGAQQAIESLLDRILYNAEPRDAQTLAGIEEDVAEAGGLPQSRSAR
ncbi:MAG TPA: TetR/AcrR family transcriptional regulator [Streptosporangiaceae bacterium]